MYSRKTSKVAISLILAMFFIATLFAGCGQNADNAGTEQTTASAAPAGTTAAAAVAEKDEKTAITMWAPPEGTYKPDQQQGDWYKADLIPAFNAVYPNITVDCQLVPWDGINEKVTVAIASKTTPDVYWDYGGRALPYANMGALEPLDDLFTPEQMEVFSNPDIQKMTALNGKIYIMPFKSTIVMLMLNKSMWEAAGAADLLPKDEYRTWTPEEFKAALKAVANKEKGIYGMTLYALNEQGDQLYNNTMVGFGAKLFNGDYSKYTATDTAAAAEALKFFKSIVDEGLCHPHPETLSSTNALDYFRQGKNGIVVAGPATIGIIKNGLADGSIQAPLEYMYVNFPSATKGQAALRSDIGNGCVFKSADPLKTKWAKKFLYWAYNDNDIVYNVTKCFNVTGKSYDWLKEDPELQYMANTIKKAEEWPMVDPGWGIKGYSEMRAAQFPEIQQMFINKTTPEETVANIAAKFNDIIAKYNK